MLVAFIDTDRVFTKGSCMPSVSRIEQVIVSRLRSLKELKEETSPVGHSSSIGMVRERRLISLLKDLLPNGIDLDSGFVCDFEGGISPQIDCIITEVDPIPCLDFDDLYKLIPVEKALMCIEIKSTLDSAGIDQLLNQVRVINSMKRCVGNSEGGSGFMPPTFFSIIALESRVSKERIRDVISSDLNIRQVTVVGDYSIRNSSWDTFSIEEVGSDENYFETRKALCWLLNVINGSIEERRKNLPMSNRRRLWEPYLVGFSNC